GADMTSAPVFPVQAGTNSRTRAKSGVCPASDEDAGHEDDNEDFHSLECDPARGPGIYLGEPAKARSHFAVGRVED
ncbi:MAG: hypothetical protein ABSC24_14130, partial [Verrucomicrobiota bacterium]